MKRHQHGSRRLLGDLTFALRQRRMWARYAAAHGRSGEALAHIRKAQQAEAALKTMSPKKGNG